MPYNLSSEGAEGDRNVPYAYAPGLPAPAPLAPTVTPAAPRASSPFTPIVQTGAQDSRYQAPSLVETQQKQLLAARMGLDLAGYQQYALNPARFMQQYGQYMDPATGVFKIPNVTPGALASSGGATLGPNGMVLAAGSTPDKPIDLSTIERGRIERTAPGREFIQAGRIVSGANDTVTPFPAQAKSANFLPPYLQPQQGATNGAQLPVPQTPTPLAAAPVTPQGSPITPFVPAAAAPPTPGSPLQPFVPDLAKPNTKGGFASAAKALELPQYLRNLYG